MDFMPNAKMNRVPMPWLLSPADQRPATVTEAVKAAVETFGGGALKPPSGGGGGGDPDAKARALLRLLVECYLRQSYSSRNAVAQAARDPEFPWSWWEEFPDGATLSEFRANNAAALQRCLAAVLRYMAEEKIFSGELTRINLSQISEEAARRITMAAFTDRAEIDRI